MKRLLLIPILFLAGFGNAQIVDQFTYTGALNANGWTNHSGTAGQITTLGTPSDDGASLSYSGFAVSSGNRIALNEANSEDINHSISGITGVGYMSFLLKVQNMNDLAAGGDYFIGFGGPNANPLAARTFIRPGVAPNTFQLGIQNTTTGTVTQSYVTTEYPVGTTVLVVIKYDNTTSPQMASLFVNPVIGGAEPTPGATNNSGTAVTFNNFATIYLRQGGNTGNLEIDEIRAGSTWADVTPTGPVGCNTTSSINVSECETYTVPSGDETYVVSGTYMDTIPNAALCDSIITINLTIKNNTTATISEVACGSYIVPSGDETYMVSGTYMDTIPNAAMCDSIITINLTITGSITYYEDFDLDGFGNPVVSQPGCAPISGYVTNDDDCDDTDNTITVGTTYYADTDNDGFGDPNVSQVSCIPVAGHVTNDDDCDDTNAAIGLPMMYYVDVDGDTYGDASATGVSSCTPIVGSVTNNTDCNDNDVAINPGATEIPNNGIDEDCNGSDLNTIGAVLATYEFQGNTCAVPVDTASNAPANVTFGLYGAAGSITCAAASNVFNYSGFNTTSTVDPTQYFHFTVTPDNCYGLDLNRIIFNHKTSGTGLTPIVHLRSSLDNFASDIATKQLPNDQYKTDTINLGAAFDNITSAIEFRWYITEIGQTGSTYRHDNVKVIGNINSLPSQTYYADADGDGFGDAAVSQTACTTPAGHVLDNTDCDDTNEEEFPGAVWYADVDGDGLGDAGSSQTACLQPANHVSDNTDCNDNDDQIGAEEMYYVDADGDGFGDADATGTASCTVVAGSVTNNEDCDDTDDQVNPDATEVCDGVDNNCDGNTDEGFTQVTYYEDADNDTYGDASSSVMDCVQPTGYVTNDDDCDDTNAAINPGAADNTGNGIDENCDGVDGMLGIEESILANLNVYPNPGTSSVVLSLSNGWNGFQATFAGVDGKEIALTSVQKSANELEFNTESLVSGVYFIRLTSAEGTALVRWVKN